MNLIRGYKDGMVCSVFIELGRILMNLRQSQGKGLNKAKLSVRHFAPP
uniref:Uncharacterized protein n=1 Tax=Rhizophora mucronata TaxID=61149 RepID=A0A2P2NJI0_RHIMU